MQKIKIHIFYWLLVLSSSFLTLSSCNLPTKVSSHNIADLYRSEEHTLHPQFCLLHVNDTDSRLFFKIDQSELLYERKNPSDSFTASVRVFARVNLSYDSPLILDSNSKVLNFRSENNNNNKKTSGVTAIVLSNGSFYPFYNSVTSMSLKLNKGMHYLITIITTDLNSKREEVTYLDADKTSLLGSQNFFIRDASNDNILFTHYFDTCITVNIKFPISEEALDKRHQNPLFIQYYKNNFPIATPPFTSDDENKTPRISPDSSFVLYPRGNTCLLTLKSKGAYHIMTDSTDFRGLTLYRFDEHFPNIAEAYQMVPSLRYISTNEEFAKITSSANPKKDVDDFWLTASGDSKDRAKQLIHNYYSRVQDANRYFTSYLEGWKTDRGMVYLIFGAPSIIFRTAEGEVWTYGEDRSYLSLTFTFIKLENPFSDNDYALQRSANYRNLWYNAVDMWREGRIY